MYLQYVLNIGMTGKKAHWKFVQFWQIKDFWQCGGLIIQQPHMNYMDFHYIRLKKHQQAALLTY